jgi:hypothetical protein
MGEDGPIHLFNGDRMVRRRNAALHFHDRAGLCPEGILAVLDLIEVDPDAWLSPKGLAKLDRNRDLAFRAEPE